MRSAPPGDVPRRLDPKNNIESDAAEVSKINKVTHQSMLWYIAPILAVAVLCVLIVMFFIMKRYNEGVSRVVSRYGTHALVVLLHEFERISSDGNYLVFRFERECRSH